MLIRGLWPRRAKSVLLGASLIVLLVGPARGQAAPFGPGTSPGSQGSGGDLASGLELGTVWLEDEAGWRGVWTRRGDTNRFDAVWTSGTASVTAQLTIEVEGKDVVVARRESSDGNDCDYSGRIADDGQSVSGTVRYDADRSVAYPWSARIERRSGGAAAATAAGNEERPEEPQFRHLAARAYRKPEGFNPAADRLEAAGYVVLGEFLEFRVQFLFGEPEDPSIQLQAGVESMTLPLSDNLIHWKTTRVAVVSSDTPATVETAVVAESGERLIARAGDQNLSLIVVDEPGRLHVEGRDALGDRFWDSPYTTVYEAGSDDVHAGFRGATDLAPGSYDVVASLPRLYTLGGTDRKLWHPEQKSEGVRFERVEIRQGETVRLIARKPAGRLSLASE